MENTWGSLKYIEFWAHVLEGENHVGHLGVVGISLKDVLELHV
jgi:hypothetical protein